MHLRNAAYFSVATLLSIYPTVGDDGPDSASLSMQPKIVEEVKRFTSGENNFEPMWNTEQNPSAKSVNQSTAQFLDRLIPKISGPKLDSEIPIEIDPETSDARFVGGKWFVNFNLKCQGIPLTDRSNISGIMTRDGEQAVFRQRNLPTTIDFDYEGIAEPNIEVKEDEARSTVVTFVLNLAEKREVELDEKAYTIAPEPKLRIWVDPESKVGHLSWEMLLIPREKSDLSKQAYKVYVTAAGEKKNRVVQIDELVFNDHHGSVTGPIWNPTPLDMMEEVNLPSVKIIRTPQHGSEDETITNEAGEFQFGPGDDQVSIRAELRSNYFRIRNAQGRSLLLSSEGDLNGPVDLQYLVADDESVAQISGFYWAHKVRDFASEILSDQELRNVTVVVNAIGQCNASWDSRSKTMFLMRASPSGSTRNCVNRAYRDTIFHELGHAIDHEMNGIQDGAYSEGFGDSLAILFKRESCYGSNCCGPNTCQRDAQQVISWPASGEGKHRRGRIYSGFIWELIQQLRNHDSMSEDDAFELVTSWTLQVALRNPTGIDNAVELTFEVSDDDLNIGNGTPHFEAISAAADSRMIPHPSGP